MPSVSPTYPNWIGFVFIFNLIVGTGALTLPGVFAKAGWLLSVFVILLLAMISYITCCFIIEAMACANAIRNWQSLQHLSRSQSQANANTLTDRSDDSDNEDIFPADLESIPLNVEHSSAFYYRLNTKFELGEMATIFFHDFGRILFYLCFAVYLYGDLSIYSAAVAKSLRDVVCQADNSSIDDDKVALVGKQLSWLRNSVNDWNESTCWQEHTITRLEVYRIFLIGFTIIFGPFVLFSIQKTKYLQMLTALFRWLAFTFMISIAIKMLITDGAKGHPVNVNFKGIPALFGACVYSFMCHHSLPSLLAPIRDKLSVRKILSLDYAVICLFYITLAMSGIFAFDHIKDLYTLNFIPADINGDRNLFTTNLLIIIDYFLALFPIFTLSTSYPIIAITLRNNLQSLFLDMSRFDTYNLFQRRILFPLCAIFPPFFITYFTENLTSLVAFTGSYAGTGIQYLIPISLVYVARKTCKELLGSGLVNPFESPFRSHYWLIFVLVWAVICVCLVTVNFFV